MVGSSSVEGQLHAHVRVQVAVRYVMHDLAAVQPPSRYGVFELGVGQAQHGGTAEKKEDSEEKIRPPAGAASSLADELRPQGRRDGGRRLHPADG